MIKLSTYYAGRSVSPCMKKARFFAFLLVITEFEYCDLRVQSLWCEIRTNLYVTYSQLEVKQAETTHQYWETNWIPWVMIWNWTIDRHLTWQLYLSTTSLTVGMIYVSGIIDFFQQYSFNCCAFINSFKRFLLLIIWILRTI